MASNSFGKIFRITTFGESHEPAIGGVVDGCPAGLVIDPEEIKRQLDRRKPTGQFWATPRAEDDKVVFMSGLNEGVTNGAPIAFVINNLNYQPDDYAALRTLFRPSHADFTWEKKFGRPLGSGGGRQSARESVVRVVAGTIARQLLQTQNIVLTSFVKSIGPVSMPSDSGFTQSDTDASILGCPLKETEERMMAYLKEIKEAGNTTGGTIVCSIKNAAAGLGEPVYDKLQARLAYAMLSINAVKGFEYGLGFESSAMTGSSHNDPFTNDDGTIRPKTNHAGGILGGISTGETISFTVAFKPVSTLMQPQQTVDRQGSETIMNPAGRHDVCVVPRARVIVESMAALVMADALLQARSSKL